MTRGTRKPKSERNVIRGTGKRRREDNHYKKRGEQKNIAWGQEREKEQE